MAALAAGWTEMGHTLRALDPYHNPVCTHPSPFTSMSGRKALVEEGTVDFDMLQTGHGGYESLEPTVQAVTAAVAQVPRMPVINGEVNYEGIMGACTAEVQRFLFWTCIRLGAAGHTYGANGLWQMNSLSPSRHRGFTPNWGDAFWQDAMCLPGSAQVGLGRKFLERYPRAVPAAGPSRPCRRGVSRPMRPASPVQWPSTTGRWARSSGKLMGIALDGLGFAPARVTVEPGAHYRAFYLNPRNGAETDLGAVAPDLDGVLDRARQAHHGRLGAGAGGPGGAGADCRASGLKAVAACAEPWNPARNDRVWCKILRTGGGKCWASARCKTIQRAGGAACEHENGG